MGKGIKNRSITVDQNSTDGITYRVDVAGLHDDLTSTEYAALKSAASQSQTAFNDAADDTWDWYNTATDTGDKAGLRAVFQAL